MFFDLAIEDGLRVARIVAFVMAMAAIAEHVDYHILVKLLPVIERDLRHADGGFRIVAVHMENRCLHAARHVGRIRRRTGFVGQRGEPDLVVDNQMHGAARAIAIKLREVERLGNDALPGERRVTVDQQRDHALAPGISEAVLLGAYDALHHGVDGFQMAGIGRHRNEHFAPQGGSIDASRAQVILHVAGPLRASRV